MAWTQPETVIVNDTWWTATARRADIVFPVTSSAERTDIMMNRRDPTLIFMEKLMEPFGESRSDHDIFRGLGERLGTTDAFTEGRNENQWLRELWRAAGTRAEAAGFALPDFDTFRETGRFDCPDTGQTRIQFGAFVADPKTNPLKTASGRIELCSDAIVSYGLADCPGHPVWLEPAEWLGVADAGERVHLVSGQPLTRLHGQLDNGPVSRATKVKGREPVYLNPRTAEQRGIADGDVVLLRNHRGRCLAGAVVSDAIRQDVAWMATGAWFDPQVVDGPVTDVHGNPNTLTLDKGCSGLTQGNIAHTALVWIERWIGALPEVSVFDPPTMERRI
jgi:biotin/methionine sulfoxide reductase